MSNNIKSLDFSEWTLRDLIPVLTQSGGGIIVGLVTKTSGGIAKCMAVNFGSAPMMHLLP